MAVPPWLTEVIKPFDPTPIVTGALAALTGIVGTIFTFRVSKRKAKADVQTTLNDGFKVLLNEYQEELVAARTQMATQAGQIRTLQDELRRAQLHIVSLEMALERNGIALPKVENS